MPEIHIYDVLRRPVITEKTDYQSDVLNQYSFEVDSRATKLQVKEAVEIVFGVGVEKVRTMVMPAKKGRRLRSEVTRKKEWKKAVVTLAEGEKIDLFEM